MIRQVDSRDDIRLAGPIDSLSPVFTRGRSVLALFYAVFCAGAIVALGDLRLSAIQAVGILVVWGVGIQLLPTPKLGIRSLLVAAVLVRVLLLSSPPSLSDDIFRYLWEGRVVSEGGNPYLYPPGDPSWNPLEPDPIRGWVNHPEVSAAYPPLMLWIFAFLSSIWYGPMSLKVVMGACDVLNVWLLADILRNRGRHLAPAWLYALHPLGAIESAGSGHMEAMALMCLLLAIRAWDRGQPGVGWAGLGGLLKILPITLLPILWRRSPRLTLAVAVLAVLAALPFHDAGLALVAGLGTYARDWSFNSCLFGLAETVFGGAARPAVLVIWTVVVGLALRRRHDPAAVSLWVGGLFVLLSPTVHPWYLLWAWLPALVCGVRAWNLLATLMPISYVVLAGYDPSTSSWTEPTWLPWAIYLPFLLALLGESVWHWMQPGPWAPGAVEKRLPSPSRT